MLRRQLDRLIGGASRLALAIFFRRVEVVGRDRIPPGPRIVVANHVNGLIDPLFVLGPLRLPGRMLGKSTLWRIPVLAQLLDLGGVLPVYRRMDAGEDPRKNLETFVRCRDELAAGGTIAIFPEGISHDEPQLQPLRTGAARIALESEVERGPLGVSIVPVGLVFEARQSFRSRALVVVGEPIDPAAEVELARRDPRAAVRALTERIAAAIERVTLNYRSWQEARWIEIGADIFEAGAAGEAGEGNERAARGSRALARKAATRRVLAEGLETLRDRAPEEIAAAVRAIHDYEALLRTLGVTDAQATADYSIRPALRFALRTLARILVAAPVALLGTLLNVVPYLLVGRIASRFSGEPNQVATYKLFPSLVVYPFAWLAEGVGAGLWLGALSGVALAVAAPLSGYVALRFHERREALWRETRAFLLLRSRRGPAAELAERRRAVERSFEVLVERWRELQASASDASRA
ncbi:MAG: 1-acyl-sn-glycerol-3-phosphate acyltransferase [Holophagales bacterium]|nr:1-acyl-sn-glycerol-3-phosphate acyltransferase [Holophagales bacterium]